MTAKQQTFVQEYLVDLNATQAAIRAGYSERSAASIGEENLRKPEIAAAVKEALAARAERAEIDQDYVLGLLKTNAERALQAEPVLDREGNPTGEYRYEGSVVNGAAKLLGQHLGMFREKVEHTGRDGGPIEFVIESAFRIDQDQGSGTVPGEPQAEPTRGRLA